MGHLRYLYNNDKSPSSADILFQSDIRKFELMRVFMRVSTSSGMYDMIQDLDQFEGVVIILGCGYNGRCNLPNFNRLKL